MNRTAAPRFPTWFKPSDGRMETYPLQFPALTKFDNFKVAASRRRFDVPLERYQAVGVDCLDYPSFGNPAFYDYTAHPSSYYAIPGGRPWLDYLNSVGLHESELSATPISPAAQNAVNYIADNLVPIENDLIVDQRSESGVLDITTSYYRIAQRVAQRILNQVNAGQRASMPIYAGGYIFYANSDVGFWQFDLAGSGDKSRPLRHKHFYNGDWKQYNTYFGQERWRFMSQNHGSYWQGPNFTGGVYELLNGVIFRLFARTQMPVTAFKDMAWLFCWDQCDNQEGSVTNKFEWITTNPAGRLKLRKHIHPPVEWLRLAGFVAAVFEDAFSVWDAPSMTYYDPNWIGTEGDSPAINFYPASGGGPVAWPKERIGDGQHPNTLQNRGIIDYAMLGFRQGYEVRRALGGRAISYQFLDHKIDGGNWITAQTDSSDVLYAANESRGLTIRATGITGKKMVMHYTGFGDFMPHTLTFRDNGSEDTMPLATLNGLTYSDPY